MNNYTLSIGDECGDGHGRKEYVTITTNLTKEQVEEAYRQSVVLTGIDFDNEIAADYEDNSIPKDAIKVFETFPGFKEVFDEFEDDGNNIHMYTPRDYAVVWKWFVKLSLADTDTIEIVKDLENIHIGGYVIWI